MKTNNYWYIVLCVFALGVMSSCEPNAPKQEDIFMTEAQVAEYTKDGKIYDLNDFLDSFMTEKGNYASDSSQYRTRSVDSKYPDIYLFSIDTLPTDGPGIYIRGRITTDDFSGNYYKSLVIQQIVNNDQQNLRISVDMGSSGGMYPIGQEILIRCNGLAIGRYANQPQLCVPSYNNNLYASHADEKVGWAPGRIPSAMFRNATRFIGKPDKEQLLYDVIDLSELYTVIPQTPLITPAGMDEVRKLDGRLVIITNAYFSGEYSYYGDLTPCTTGNPEDDTNANVFAPTTGNIGYPQGRIIRSVSNNSQVLTISTSEYAKYAAYYLPGADTTGVSHCKDWQGTVAGILGWYMDNAGSFPGSSTDSKNENIKSYKLNWAVTPRGIPGIGLSDIYMENAAGEEWVPQEYDPQVYTE